MAEKSAETVAFALRDDLVDLFGHDVAAMWLYGASVFGHPFVDVDLHVLLRRHPTTDERTALEAIHGRVAREIPGGDDVDCWYVPLADARRSAPPPHLAPRGDVPVVDDHWALHRAHWLAGRCTVIHGLSPSEVVSAPGWDELEDALCRELEQRIKPSSYWTLQLCRVWASLVTRDVVRSKLDSGRWALQHLSSDHHEIVRAAMRFYGGRPEPGDDVLIRDHFPGFLDEVRARIP